MKYKIYQQEKKKLKIKIIQQLIINKYQKHKYHLQKNVLSYIIPLTIKNKNMDFVTMLNEIKDISKEIYKNLLKGSYER